MKKNIIFRLHVDELKKIKDVPNMKLDRSSNDSISIIKIDSTNTKAQQLIEWLQKHPKAASLIYVDKIFTKKELLSADILYTNSIDWAPQELSGDGYGTIYKKIGEYSIEKETKEIFKQASPLYLNTSKLSKKKDIQITLSSEIIVTKKFKEICEKNKITGCSFDPIFRPNKIIENGDATEYVSSESKQSDKWFQLRVDAQAGSLSDKTVIGFSFIDIDKNPLTPIKLDNLSLISGIDHNSAIYVNKTDWLNTDIAKVQEQILSDYPENILIISQRFYRILLENNIKGFKAEPAYFS